MFRRPTQWVQYIANPALFAQATQAQRDQVRAAQIRLYYQLSHQAALATLVLALLTALAVYPRVAPGALLCWVLVVALVAAVRFAWSWRFLHTTVPDEALPRWRRRAWLVNLLQALSWCSLLIITAPAGDMADRQLVLVVLLSLGIGSIATLGYYLQAYLAFSIPLMVAVLVWFLLYLPSRSPWLALILVVVSVTLSLAARRAGRMLRGGLLLNHEREVLMNEVIAAKERLQVTLGAIGDGVISTDTDGRVVYLNPRAERLSGWSAEDAVGLPLTRVLPLAPSGDAGLDELLQQCLRQGKPLVVAGDRRLSSPNGGRETAVQIKLSPIRDARQRIIGVLVVLHDVTELAGLAAQISHQARHDALTGLLNRASFTQRIAEAVEYARRHDVAHAVCYLDLDQFKIVNDTCGHVAGDELLRQLAQRLRAGVREQDALARLGGDEFGILLFCCRPNEAKALADRICTLVREFRFTWGDEVFTIGASIGLVPFDGNDTPPSVLAAADAACYVAKDQGRDRVHVAYPGDEAVASRHDQMRQTTLIQRALDESRFRLRFQRIEPLRSGAVPVKAEFLVSVRSQEGALLAPAQFLPAAERYHMMPKLDRHIVRLALQYIGADCPELEGIDVFSINLSGQSLADREFLDYVLRQLTETGVAPHRICFEITETAVIGNLDAALRFIERLRAVGCSFALDDFGTGLSSFGYLRSLPVDYLKIDGQFVRNLGEDRINRAIVESINQIGHLMGAKTVAEFVEDQFLRAALRDMGVDYGQGWGIHRPVLLPPLPAVSPAV